MSYRLGKGSYAHFEAIYKRLSAFSELDLLYYADAVLVAIGDLQEKLHLKRFKAYSLVSLLNRFVHDESISMTTFKALSGQRDISDEFTRFFLLGRIGG